jgi:hypothetical protein
MVDWGDVPTWVGSVSATFALLGAFMAVWQATKVYKLERARDEETRLERVDRERTDRRKQAARVSAWLDQVRSQRSETLPIYAFAVRNASDLPVYDVRLSTSMVTEQSVMAEAEDHILVLPPSDSPRLVPILDCKEGSSPASGVLLRFTDAAGVRWERNMMGVLKEISRGP